MTLSTAGYTVGANLPLNHARILWAPISGTVTADGTDGALAANEFTFQRWAAAAGLSAWTLTTASTVALDTVFIAAHNLTGKTFRSQVGGASRTNEAFRSQEFDDVVWGLSLTTVTANAAPAPDGTTTADKLIPTVAAGNHFASQATGSVTAGVSYTFSGYCKADGYGWVYLAMGGGFISGGAFFNLTTGAFGSSFGIMSRTITDCGGGWWRVSMTAVATATGGVNFWTFWPTTGDGVTSFTGNGTSGILAWGAQIETGAVATSYIPTTFSAATSDWHDIHSWITPTDSSAIAIMTNNAGVPWSTGKFRVLISDGDGVEIGIIRAGVALQMQQPVFGGVNPVGLNRLIETRHSMSETGQWLGRTIQRQALRTTMDWQHLEAAWYRASFEPFARTLPQRPFGLIQNPLRMPESVAWCWTDESPAPQNMGLRDLMSVSLNITGFLE
jgi:hypothetical protein